MKAYRPSASPCPIGRAARVLGDRWAMLILREAMLGCARFDDFLARLEISRAALSSRLSWLVEAGLLSRNPPDARRALYRLTPAGEALRPIYRDLADWGTRHLPLASGSTEPAPWAGGNPAHGEVQPADGKPERGSGKP